MDALRRPKVHAAAFRFCLNRERLAGARVPPGLFFLELATHLRSSLLQLPFGDQAPTTQCEYVMLLRILRPSLCDTEQQFMAQLQCQLRFRKLSPSKPGPTETFKSDSSHLAMHSIYIHGPPASGPQAAGTTRTGVWLFSISGFSPAGVPRSCVVPS